MLTLVGHREVGMEGRESEATTNTGPERKEQAAHVLFPFNDAKEQRLLLVY